MLTPTVSMKMLSGLRSRWKMPFSWASLRLSGDLLGELQRLQLGDLALLEPLAQAGAGEQLHHHVRPAVLALAVLEHADGGGWRSWAVTSSSPAEADDELAVGEGTRGGPA